MLVVSVWPHTIVVNNATSNGDLANKQCACTQLGVHFEFGVWIYLLFIFVHFRQSN